MLSFKKHLTEARAMMLTIDWEHGDPNDQGADEWESVGVFVHSWDERKNLLTIAGEKRYLHKWLMDYYGLIKRSADIAIKDDKPLR